MKLEILPHARPCATCGRGGKYSIAGKVICGPCLRSPKVKNYGAGSKAAKG